MIIFRIWIGKNIKVFCKYNRSLFHVYIKLTGSLRLVAVIEMSMLVCTQKNTFGREGVI